MNRLASSLGALLFAAVTACVPDVTPSSFVVSFGGPEAETGEDVVIAADGSLVIVGGTRSMGAGGSDLYLVKLGPSGERVWERTFGGALDDGGADLVALADGYAACGVAPSFGPERNRMYLVRTDLGGNEIWSQSYTGPAADANHCFGLVATAEGGFALAGNSTDTDSWLDFRLTIVDAAGAEIVTQYYGNSRDDTAWDISRTADGGYLLAGHTGVWSSTPQAYVVRTDMAGAKLWDYKTGGETGQAGDAFYRVMELGDGSIVAVGTLWVGDGQDVVLAKLDAQGMELWKRTYGGPSEERGYGLAITSDGGFVVVGTTKSFGAGGYDAYLIRLDAGGIMSFEKTFGTDGDDLGQAVAVTADGGYALVGWTDPTRENPDVYVVRTDAFGEVSDQ